GQGNNNNMNATFNNMGNNNIMDMLNEIIANEGSNNTNVTARSVTKKNSRSDKHRKRNNNNNINPVGNNFSDMFSEIFNQTFTAVINNQDLIENIVDTVLNSDLVGSMIEEIEKLDSMNLELKDYNDKYLIEGKLPGINKKDIDLDYEDNTVTIKVKSNQLFTNGKNRIVTIIQPSSDIEKKFIVDNVDTNKISAVFESDILRVYLPKKRIETNDSQIIDVENYILE
ncbi:MAG: Hsp20 family protein, partial [Clostridium sp.]